MENELKVFDLTPYLFSFSKESEDICKELAQCMIDTGVVIVRDPRVDMESNDKFIQMMENYFENAKKRALKGFLKEEKPEIHYQVGVTPENKEMPRALCDEKIRKKMKELKATEVKNRDPKWRYLWRMGNYPAGSLFQDLNAENIIPEGMSNWEHNMNEWGNLILQTGETVTEMLSTGLGLERDTLSHYLIEGPHLLAPTGTDLNMYGKLNTVFAGFHTDLSFLTLHGKSRFPGLYIWLKNGKKIPVKVPYGCILIQAGQQLEYLTGGTIQAGYHEVICDENTMDFIEVEKRRNRPLWRVSSTMFTHLKSDKMLRPLRPFLNHESKLKYPPIPVGMQVRQELEKIKLF